MPDIPRLASSSADSMSRCLGGITLVAAITGVVSGVAHWTLGVPYAVLLGVWIALTSCIPTRGAYLGAVPALPMALAQSPATLVLTSLVLLTELWSVLAVSALVVVRVLFDFFRVRPK